MQVLTATVKTQPREVNTKFGQRSVMDVTLPNGQEQAIWGPANFAAIANCYQGQSVAIAVDSKGKYHIVEDSQPAAVPAVTQTQPAKPEGMTPESKKAIAAYVEEMGSLYAFCYTTAAVKLAEAPNEAKQAMASSLFIAAQRKFNLT
jgi:hypothetical protein